MEYKTLFENIEGFEIFSLTAICFFIPMLLSNQLVIGILVNTSLAFAAYRIKMNQAFPLIIAPALGALCGGIIFGGATLLLVYMIPFIWLSNFIFVKLVNRYKIISVVIAPVVKSAFLFVSAFTLFSAGLIPSQFLILMGPMQLLTGIFGVSIGTGISRL